MYILSAFIHPNVRRPDKFLWLTVTSTVVSHKGSRYDLHAKFQGHMIALCVGQIKSLKVLGH